MKKVFVPLAIMRLVPNSIAQLNFIRETYITKLFRYDLIPILVPVNAPQSFIDQAYRESGGILIMGGGDISPTLYGATPHSKTVPDDIQRDKLELAIIKRALNDRKPILGICRGCQMLAVATGGTLNQHLPDIVPAEKHSVDEGGTYENLTDAENGHDVLIKADTRARELLGKEKIRVTSGHHQSIKNTGNLFTVSGESPAGIIEIIEHRDSSYFCFGLQSHPECCNADFSGNENKDNLDIFFEEFKKALV